MSAVRRAAPWVVTAVALGAVALLLIPRGQRSRHPEPRADAGAMAITVLPAANFARNPQAATAYQVARQIPQVLDGLYCYCHCKENMRHRSLLTCFQSEHAAACDICMGEAQMAYQMTGDGKSLQDIRVAIDLAYGG